MDGYEFLVGDAILALIWLFGFVYRKDLRKPMVWSGVFYAVMLGIFLLLFRIGTSFYPVSPAREIVPGYWNPKTLFDLGRVTGGYAIEDGLFMFFVGGISTYVYELFFNKRIQFKRTKTFHLKAIKIAGLAAAILAIFTHLNFIYAMILFSFTGAAVIWTDRKDLVKHSLFGGLCFTIIYISGFLVFNFIFPNFIHEFYNLKNISGVLILGIPLEEYLYALSFGLMWAPFYEYEHGEKDVALGKIKTR